MTAQKMKPAIACIDANHWNRRGAEVAMIRKLGICTALILTSVAPAAAQESAEKISAVTRAVANERQYWPLGYKLVLSSETPTGFERTVAEGLKAEIGNVRSAMQCNEARLRCTIPERAVFIAVGDPRLNGDVGTVEIETWRSEPGSSFVAYERALVTLKRRGVDWEVTNREVIERS